MLLITLLSTFLALGGKWYPDGTGIGFASAKTVEHLPMETQQTERRVEPEYYSTRIHVAPTNVAQVRTDADPQGSKDQVLYSKTSGQASAIYVDRVSPVHPQPGRPYWNELSINVAPINNAQYTAFYYPTTQQPEQKSNH